MNIIEIKDVYKFYGGVNALDFLSLDIERGKITGLLGPNGSGKTTLLKAIAGLVKPVEGEILINGRPPGVESRNQIAYLPDRDFLLGWMNLEDGMDFFQDFYGDFQRDKCRELMDFMDLNAGLDTKVKDLSKGMREKYNLALTLARKADIHILDEPIGGVDIVTRDRILDSIISSFNQDSTMIITTHLVADLENIFDQVAFIHQGKIVLQEEAEDLRLQEGDSIANIYRNYFRGV